MNFLKHALAALILAFAFSSGAMAAERINLNTADAVTLDRAMDGVGPAKAAAIVEHRRVNGPFRSVDQLVNVKGIGMATLERNRDRVMVAATAAPRPRVAPAARAAAPAPQVR